MAKTSILKVTDWSSQDQFNLSASGATVANGDLVLAADNTYPAANSKLTYDLTGSSISVALVSPPNSGSGSVQASLGVRLDSNNYAYLSWESGNVAGSYYAAGTGNWGSGVAYDPAVHRYFRIREASGTIYWEHSANASTWTVLRFAAVPWATTSLTVYINAGFWGTETNPGSAIFGDVNAEISTSAPGGLSPAVTKLKQADGSWLTVTVRHLPFSDFAATMTPKTFTESAELIANPDRGWYQYTETHWTDAAGAGHTPLDANQAIAKRTGTESVGGYTVPARSVVFRYYVIEHMRNTDVIPQAFLDALSADFAAARTAGVKLIIRFSYSNDGTTGANFDGPGPYNNDTTVDRTLGHVAQLKPVIAANTDVIHAVQTGFIGTWGEWYYTDHWGNKGNLTATDWENRARLITAMLDWGKGFYLLLRYVGVKRRYVRERSGLTWQAPHDAVARLGFHNDAFMASGDDSDWGTFNTMVDGMTIPEARAYLAAETARPVPMVGETAGVSTRSGYTSTAASLAEHHWSALNPNYHADVLSSWTSAQKDEVSRKLGYRLRLTSAELPTAGAPTAVGQVRLTIVNDGYAAPTLRNPLQLVFTGGTTVVRDLGVDVRQLTPGTHTIVRDVALPPTEGTFAIHLAMPSPLPALASRPEYAVRLANTTAWANGRNDLGVNTAVAVPATGPIPQWQMATVDVNPTIRSYVSTDHSYATKTVTSETVTRPPQVVAGDLILIYTLMDSGTTTDFVQPSGFTLLGKVIGNPGVRLMVSYKVATASEPATYTLGRFSAGADGASTAIAVKDWSGSTANLTFALSTTSNTTMNSPSIVPKTSRSLLLNSIGTDDDSTVRTWGWIPPISAGVVGYTHNTAGWASGAISHEHITGTTATGVRTWSVNTASTQTTRMTSSLSIPAGTATKTITEFLSASAQSGGSEGPLTDTTDNTFVDSAGVSSRYHLFAAGLDWTKNVGLMVYTDGSGEWGLDTPQITSQSPYLLYGTNGLINVAKRQNMVLLTPRAPGGPCNDGDGVCWYDHSAAVSGGPPATSPWEKLEWSNELIRWVLTQYNIDRRRIAIGGYSSGAQWTMSWWGPKYGSEIMQDGVAVGISYGGQPRVTPKITSQYKAAVPHIWDVGSADTSYSQPTWDDGVQTGRAWYQSNGFAVTDLVLVSGKGHDRYNTSTMVGEFGPIMEREILAHVPPA